MASCEVDLQVRELEGELESATFSFAGKTYVVAADLSTSNSVGSDTSHFDLDICVGGVDGRNGRESMDC